MKTSLLMEFSVDKENSTINVKREFAAPLPQVWAAWTESQLLDQWWAPKPWMARTKVMNFNEGGYWLYAMVGPDGTEQWCRFDYKGIEYLKKFSGKDSFCDENGNITNIHPGSLWRNKFAQEGDSTIVDIDLQFDKLTDLESYIEMGFKEGLTAAMENLDELFQRL